MRVFTAFLCATLFASCLLFSPGGEAEAGPFARFRSCPNGQCPIAPPTDPPAIGPSQESREEAPHVPQPWSLDEATVLTSLPPQDTVLDPVPGTGSKLLIGPKAPDQIGLKLDPALLDALKKLAGSSLQPTQPVPISLPVEAATSERLSRVLMLLEVLAWLATAMGGSSLVGKLLPLAARLAAGLPSAIPAPSPAPTPTPAAPSSAPPSK